MAAELTVLDASRARLVRWLVEDAYPLWWSRGADRQHGGFHERLEQNGQPVTSPRRARLHPRQMFAFSLADEFGVNGMSKPAVAHALDFFLSHYVRADQLIRTCVAPDGSCVDDSVLLYDQAFALLGYASAYGVFHDLSLRQRAHTLLETLHGRLANPAGGFFEAPDRRLAATSNSHMHLLEAALAWRAIDHDERWRRLAANVVELACTKLIDARTSQIREFYTDDWHPANDETGSIVEPGHQFEWAWLLLRWCSGTEEERVAKLATSLIDGAESRGVDRTRDVAINSIWLDGRVRDVQARLWPQTERLKANCAAWALTRSPRYLNNAQRSAAAIESYLRTETAGLWRDRMNERADFVEEPAPASSLYHLVAAIAEFSATSLRPAEESALASKHS
ncbi:AGE family epimerase/isomerase [Steroidobacter sp. S1-65]|uniref:AGE family epimerase/isomerase n=1 Tax=Steroidobacter gossypii TaxID=2805490 RepID=A0ABS1WV61_9GAMM|nr:AGE family epimerase/isomerase [Steroidobacter gossypii]MBM0104843.1 AGE family epimerase/isomerase [Steroidobacter gossypii]